MGDLLKHQNRIGFAVLITILATGLLAAAQEPAASMTDHEIKVRQYWVQISKELGVTCDYCHNVNNFKSFEKPQMKRTQEHVRIVELLNKKGFTYKDAPKADCYMCHRGKAIPDFKMVSKDQK